MPSDGQPCAREVGVQALFEIHLLQRRGLLDLLDRIEQRTRRTPRALGFPHCVTPADVIDEVQGACLCQCAEFVLSKFGNATHQIVDALERRCLARILDCATGLFA